MSYIKKFTDFFAVLGAVSAMIYLISQFMPFEPLETQSTLGKIKEFFAAHGTVDYMAITVLALLLLLSFRHPYTTPNFLSPHHLPKGLYMLAGKPIQTETGNSSHQP
jgi:hypothetical protein